MNSRKKIKKTVITPKKKPALKYIIVGAGIILFIVAAVFCHILYTKGTVKLLAGRYEMQSGKLYNIDIINYQDSLIFNGKEKLFVNTPNVVVKGVFISDLDTSYQSRTISGFLKLSLKNTHFPILKNMKVRIQTSDIGFYLLSARGSLIKFDKNDNSESMNSKTIGVKNFWYGGKTEITTQIFGIPQYVNADILEGRAGKYDIVVEDEDGKQKYIYCQLNIRIFRGTLEHYFDYKLKKYGTLENYFETEQINAILINDEEGKNRIWNGEK